MLPLKDLVRNTELETLFFDSDWMRKIENPWKLLALAKRALDKSLGEISDAAQIEKSVTLVGPVCIGPGTKITGASYIVGPVYIGSNCILGPNCFIRPHSILADEIIIGYNCYVTDSLICSKTGIFHFCGISRSIVGQNCMITSYSQTASVRQSQKNVMVKVGEKLVDTGLEKFGCVIGPNTHIGTHTLILPGRLIGNNCRIGSHLIISRNIPDNTSVTAIQQEQTQEIKEIEKLDFPIPKIHVAEEKDNEN